MSIHAPVFLKNVGRGENKETFTVAAKEDIVATIEFLYKRGMWSKFHYEKWKAEAEKSTDDIFLHGWWDAIVSSAMFEMETDDLEEYNPQPVMGKGLMMILDKDSEGLASKIGKSKK